MNFNEISSADERFENIVWVGSYPSESFFKKLVTCGYKGGSGYVAQKNLVEGLRYSFSNKVTVIGAYKIQGKSNVFLPGSVEIIDDINTYISTPVLSLPYVTDVWNGFCLPKAAKKWAKTHMDESTLIFCYAASYPQMKAALKIKEIMTSSTVCLIIPDLPQFMSCRTSRLYKFAKSLDFIRIQRLLPHFDKYVCFTKSMIAKLNLDKTKCMVMEGTINLNDLPLNPSSYDVSNSPKTCIMYSGELAKGYGIELLLEAMKELPNEQHELWITGSGALSSLVQQYSEIDNRVKYYGFINSREKLLELQRNATMFYVGRLPSQANSSYCFPSKIFEYLVAGKLVISFELGGIPDEYYDYLVKIEEESPKGISRAIESVKQMMYKERLKRIRAGYDFVKNTKNNVYQTKLILKFAVN